ncbi:hypothetical protein ACFLYV_05290 [Chloroflexota bacterium]
MQFDENVSNFLLFIGAMLFLGFNYFTKKRRSENTPLGLVTALLADLKHNTQKLVGLSYNAGMKQLHASAWQKGSGKIDFLPVEVRQKLERAFSAAIEANDRIGSARKFGSSSYMAGIDPGKLRLPMEAAETALQQWLAENMDNPAFTPPRRKGLFG